MDRSEKNLAMLCWCLKLWVRAMNDVVVTASYGRRVLATLIDFVVVPIVSFLIMLVTGAMESADAYAGLQPFLRGIGLGVVGYLVVNGWWLLQRGQTLGKLVTGIKIVTATSGEKAPVWRLIFLRALFFPLLYLPLAFSFIGYWAFLLLVDLGFSFRKDRRCLHDWVADTRVVLITRNQA
ncbi:MAG: hypothetical protein GKR90_25980 [Pseudomonadales bacterium]|nr:hypothetical protein [Pseudomonadales bacterium]